MLAAVNFEICHAWVHLSLRWLGQKKYVFPPEKIVGCWGQNYTLEWTFECFFSHLIKTPLLTCSAGFLTQNINITDDVQASNIQYPLSALLKGQRSIKLWSFFSGGVFEFFQFFPQNAPKRGLLEQKKWRFIRIMSKWWSNWEWPFICEDTKRGKLHHYYII